MWRRIRTFGELQILTRASYVMLVLVPVLAAVWPAIRVAINRYNEAVTESRVALESAADRIEFATSGAVGDPRIPSRITAIVDDLNTRIDVVIEGYAPKTIEDSRLPSAWAFAFLASLSVTLAHVIYQAFAPPLIRRLTSSEHMTEEARRFGDSPSQWRLEYAARSLDNDDSDLQRHAKIIHEPLSEAKRRVEITIIEKGAFAHYLRMSKTAKPAAVVSGVLYLIGLALIAWIIYTQTRHVVSATWGG